jgi:steroid delta-isomerase-like uncharacterized protein
MSLEDNKALVRRTFEEVWMQGNLAAVDQLFAPDYIMHNPRVTWVVLGHKSVKDTVTEMRTAFPDFSLSVEDVIAEGEKVMTRYTWRGTQQGPFLGIAPTGKQATVTGILVSRVVNGKIAEEWGVVDMFGLMRQLGVIPAMG